ncbi:magnesium chelatase accessory protein [Rhodovulum imhoffii]|uniref:Magnesium chelatase accessory protein n=1 Tax=Rhodovulum imhoffii TaxID=365340 RepID=A0A2T5BSK2_9RHOB|nr:alpha/beta fold hydrolase BchO [Rhodovulum imhoffii]MBK5933436.1 magnesium chelatase [Rhodovulum imhoffii]PTN02327.1 magnesium chelatase accessory protein [Rhodovulum imhoffii]
MEWRTDGADWPNNQFSRFVRHRPHYWHVQQAGAGPVVLLLHGTGGSTHSWRDMIPLLARNYTVVALDLPGQGFTRMGARQRCGLDNMSTDIAGFMAGEGLSPAAIIGHSAGGAIALRMAGRMDPAPGAVVGINAALSNFEGAAGTLFPMMARMLSLNPFTASMFARFTATESNVKALIGSTGSELTPEGLALYRRLISDRHHVDATLTMMAQWSLEGLQADLPEICVPTLFVTGDKDQAVPPRVAESAVARMPRAEHVRFAALGHLAHEEAPEAVAMSITAFLRAQGVG